MFDEYNPHKSLRRTAGVLIITVKDPAYKDSGGGTHGPSSPSDPVVPKGILCGRALQSLRKGRHRFELHSVASWGTSIRYAKYFRRAN